LQCVAVCCSVLQVLQCVALCCSMLQCKMHMYTVSVLHYVSVVRH